MASSGSVTQILGGWRRQCRAVSSAVAVGLAAQGVVSTLLLKYTVEINASLEKQTLIAQENEAKAEASAELAKQRAESKQRKSARDGAALAEAERAPLSVRP